jgi:hypothetical protein
MVLELVLLLLMLELAHRAAYLRQRAGGALWSKSCKR